MNTDEYTLLKKRIKDLLNFDLENYKANQMTRRLEGYIARSGAGGVVQYCSLLLHDKTEQEKLKNFLTINVSGFFRDKEYFEVLNNRILPYLLKTNRRLNIWSAGCSNGAEPYSIAILMEKLSPFSKHRILATDVDDKSLAVAIAGGPYTSLDLKNVPEEQRIKCFNSRDNNYWILPRFKAAVEFRKHDLLLDDFESGFDLIICRNVIIYFTDIAKKRLREKFLCSLNVGGILFIGATETMLDAESVGLERVSPCFFKKVKPFAFDRSGETNSGTGGVKVK